MTDSTPKTYGQWILKNLNDLNMTQKDFAKQVCVSQAAVGSWTRDHREPSIRNFLWTCKIFSLLKNQSFFSVVKQGIKFFIQ